MQQVKTLCEHKDVRVKPPSGFVKAYSKHYGVYKKKKLVSLLSYKIVNLNRVPGSVAVVIDLAASIEPHIMSTAFESIKKQLKRRMHKCVICTQVSAWCGPIGCGGVEEMATPVKV